MQLPRAFGPYTLLKRLAVGGMAEIYVAKTAGLGGFEKLVAIKLVHPHLSADPHFVRMLVDEAKILVLLTHANVAQVFDLGCIEGTYFISMEFVEGVDVHGLQKAAARAAEELPIPVCCFLVAEMLNGLDYAHRKRDASGRPLNIVHRDVSPQNVLISHAGEVKLVDFGIAKTSLRVEGTEVGVIKGKYYYMSPEQAWADAIDRRSDVFSTGIVLFEMLTGRMLYSARSIPELIGKVRAAEIPSPVTLRPEIPEALSNIVMKALERDPNARYQNALDFSEALRDYLYETAPAFNASRLAQYVTNLLDKASRVSGDPNAKADETGRLRALTRDEFVRTENSVIFALQASNNATQTGGARAAARARTDGSVRPAVPSLTPPPKISGWPLEDTDGGAEPPTERVRGGLLPGGRSVAPPAPGSRIPPPPGAPPSFAPGSSRLPSFSIPPAAPLPTRTGSLPVPPMAARASLGAAPADQGSSHGIGPRVSTLPRPSGQATGPLATPSRASLPPLPSLPPGNGHGSNGRASLAPPRLPLPPPPRPEEPAEPTGQYRPKHAAAMAAGRFATNGPSALPGALLPGPSRMGVPTPALVPPPGEPQPVTPIPPSPLIPDFGSDHGFASRSRFNRRTFQVVVGVAVMLCCLLAFRLAGGAPRPPQLEVISVPQGARVRVDGAVQTGFTPLRITGLDEGRHYALRVELPGYLPWEASYRATAGAVQHIAVLQPITGEIQVLSTPQGATVFLDDAAVGKTPLTISSLTLGRRIRLRVSHPGYADAKREVTVTEAELKGVERFTLTQPLHPRR
jgi:serine/threonine protein kinase